MRLYTVEFSEQTIAAASGDYDIFELLPAANKPIRLHAISLDVLSEVGDSAEEILRMRIIRGHTTSGSGGGTPTPRPVDENDAAAGFTAETCNSTIASVGTAVNLWSGGFNVRVGMREVYTPEQRFRCQNASLLVLRLVTAVADDLVMSGTAWVSEE